MPQFTPIIRFGFNDSNKSEYDLQITVSYGENILRTLIPERRKELVEVLRIYADIIECGSLSKENGADGQGSVGEQPTTPAGVPETRREQFVRMSEEG